MNRSIIAGVMLLAVPAAALAQTKQIQADIDKALQQARAYQDIEIMRRLVQRRVFSFAVSCSKCHADPFTGQRLLRVDESASILADALDRPNYSRYAADEFAFWSEGADAGKRPARLASSDTIIIDGHYIKG